jgi:hypothetical protein
VKTYAGHPKQLIHCYFASYSNLWNSIGGNNTPLGAQVRVDIVMEEPIDGVTRVLGLMVYYTIHAQTRSVDVGLVLMIIYISKGFLSAVRLFKKFFQI